MKASILKWSKIRRALISLHVVKIKNRTNATKLQSEPKKKCKITLKIHFA